MALEITNVSKTFGSFQAVDERRFSVSPGRIFGFLGTNGAGKTTTMRMILDIIRADSGTITWNGEANTGIARGAFGYLPEERGLYPKMVVDEQLLFLAQLYGASKQAATAALDEWLERLDITENRKKRVEQLSKGNQQKIQFLAAILHDPEILILDEPFSGLDPVNADQMKQSFLEMRDRGKTIIFSTHQLDDAQELCHEVAIIHRGKLMISGGGARCAQEHGTPGREVRDCRQCADTVVDGNSRRQRRPGARGLSRAHRSGCLGRPAGVAGSGPPRPDRHPVRYQLSVDQRCISQPGAPTSRRGRLPLRSMNLREFDADWPPIQQGRSNGHHIQRGRSVTTGPSGKNCVWSLE